MNLLTYLKKSDSAIESLVFTKLQDKRVTGRNSLIIEQYLSHFDPMTHKFDHGIYSPKWISTFYTLRDLTQFNIDGQHPIFQKGLDTLINELWGSNGSLKKDICVIAMLVSLCAYGKRDTKVIDEMMDYLIQTHQKIDGGWNCACINHDTKKSSINTTLSVNNKRCH